MLVRKLPRRKDLKKNCVKISLKSFARDLSPLKKKATASKKN